MKLNKLAAGALVAGMLATPFSVLAQETHEDAKAQVEAKDAHHHTKAKIVGGSAVGGAVIGGATGGATGAVLGAGVGAGGGVIANKVRKHHEIKKREQQGTPEHY